MSIVFISHRSTDAETAERLAGDLEALGHTTKLDSRDVVVGDSITGWMNEAATDCDALVICLSGDGVAAPWISREWLSTLARCLEGEDIQLLPLRLPGGKPPALLADLKYADASRDWDEAVCALDQALRARSSRP
jgi:hypothetical protein